MRRGKPTDDDDGAARLLNYSILSSKTLKTKKSGRSVGRSVGQKIIQALNNRKMALKQYETMLSLNLNGLLLLRLYSPPLLAKRSSHQIFIETI